MKQDYTHIEILIDRSGSMGGKETDVAGGINSFLKAQRDGIAENGGTVKVSIRRFDTVYETIVENADVTTIADLTASDVNARGGTSLFDAIGNSVNSLGAYLRDLPEAERPGGVVFVVFTDGEENSSTKFKLLKDIKEMIQHQTEKYKWQFIFLGEGIDGFAAGQGYGFDAKRSVTHKSYAFAGELLGGKVASYTNFVRSMNTSMGVSGVSLEQAAALLDFDDKDRAALS